MTTTDLKLDKPGTLRRAGPIGRLVRLAFGIACLGYIVDVFGVGNALMDSDAHIRPILWNGILPGLFLISYVVNIGFSRNWKKWPAIISATVMLVLAIVGVVMQGTSETGAFARVLWGWELYVFTHLGTAFVLAALIATPGCEMRAFHDLFSRLTGIPTQEHHCPIGPLRPLDQWEAQRFWMLN